MDFWESKTGVKITGSEEDSFSGSYFPQLPDNTQCNAVIKSFTLNEYDGKKKYQVIWVIKDGDFAGSSVKQSINPYDEKPEKADIALNMLMRMFKLTSNKPQHKNEPQNIDLKPSVGKFLCIKIGNGIMGDGVERTWVREVHEENKLEISTGNTIVSVGRPEPEKSALQRNSKLSQVDDDSDIPF